MGKINIYVAGEYFNGNHYVACYWKNNRRVTLWYHESRAIAICVTI